MLPPVQPAASTRAAGRFKWVGAGCCCRLRGWGVGGFAADFRSPAFFSFLIVPFQREPSSLTRQVLGWVFFWCVCLLLGFF